MAYGQVRYEPDDWIGYFFSYDDPNGEIILVAEKQNSDEVVEIKLPAGFLMGTFDMDVLTAGTWQLRYSLKTSIYTRLCESDPITIEVVQPSQLDRLIDALSTVSAARNVTPTPTFTPEPEPTSEATP